MSRGVGLSRAKVLDLAQAIADDEGAAALTLTRLAAKAGVRKPSLYKHVEGLPDILESLTLRAYQALGEVLDAVEDPGAEGIREFAMRWRAWGLAHPGLYVIASRTHVGAGPEVFAAGTRIVDMALEHLRARGVPDGELVHAARSWRALVHGFVMLELRDGFGLGVDVSESFTRAVDALIVGWGVELSRS